MSKFDPAKPYRLTKVHQSSAFGCYGWVTTVHMFTTEDEVRAAVAAPMQAGVLEHGADKMEMQPDGSLKSTFIVRRKRLKKKKL